MICGSSLFYKCIFVDSRTEIKVCSDVKPALKALSDVSMIILCITRVVPRENFPSLAVYGQGTFFIMKEDFYYAKIRGK